MLRFGFQKTCITPKLPAPLRGYAIQRTATRAHDALFARCLFIEDGKECYGIIQCDLIGVDQLLRNAVYARTEALGIAREHLLLFATHTHSGPGGTLQTDTGILSQLQDIFGKTDPSYIDEIAEKIAAALFAAAEQLQPGTITIGRGTVENVGKERHDPSLPGDDSLLVFQLTGQDGKQVLLYNFACHPTVTGSGNTEMTADFPYAVEAELPQDMVMFLNGPCGDISSRFTRKESSFRQAEAFGEIICRSIREALEAPVFQDAWDTIGVDAFSVTLPIKETMAPEQAQAQLEEYEAQLAAARKDHTDPGRLRILESYVEGAQSAILLSKSLVGLQELEIPVSLLHIQNIPIAVIPGELFSTLGRKLKAQGLEVFCYGNGYSLYIADEKAYDCGFYEAMSSPFARGAGEQLMVEILKRYHSK